MEIYRRPRHLGEVPLGAILMLPLFGLPLGGWLLEHGYTEFGLCGMKAKFGLPCLSCGATRGTLRLFHGDPLGAVGFQPMMMLIYLILLVWGMVSFVSLIRGERVVIRLSDREDLALKIFVIAVPILNWIYLWQMGI